MAVGKNKRLTKGGKKGGKKKAGDPFLRKEWYDIKAPSMFSVRNCGKTLVSRTQGTKIATEELKGRVLEVNLADLNNDEDQASKKIRLSIEEVQGRSCLTDFHGMTLTRDKICSLIKKWQTLIEAHVDVKTTDGYVVRMFCIAFTKRRPDQVRANCYAQSAQIRKIRRKMVEVMTQEASKVQLRELVKKLIPESIGKEIEKQAQGIFPLKDVLIRKVKILKKPKFDITKLMELHGEGGDDTGVEMMRPEADDAVNTLTADVTAAAVDDEWSAWHGDLLALRALKKMPRPLSWLPKPARHESHCGAFVEPVCFGDGWDTFATPLILQHSSPKKHFNMFCVEAAATLWHRLWGQWYYKDKGGQEQRPFPTSIMLGWPEAKILLWDWNHNT